MSDDFSDDSEGIKQLRQHAKETADALKAANERLAQFEAREREATVKSVLKAKGLPEKAATFYQGDASEDAVSKWVDENADIFGVRQSGGNDANAAAAAMAQAASFGNDGSEPALGPDRKVYGDPAELLKLMKTLPYPELVKLGLVPDPKRDPYGRPAKDF